MFENLNEYKSQFINQLQKHNLEKLSFLLHEEKAVIAGSYVLQSIINEDWANDIDIWCENPNIDSIKKKLRKLGYVLVSVRKVNYRQKQNNIHNVNILIENKDNIATKTQINHYKKMRDLFNKVNNYHDMHISNYFRLRDSIKTIYTFMHENNLTIQLMETKGSHIDCIDNFDFNICRVCYDGEDIRVKNKKEFMSSIENKIAKVTQEAVMTQSENEWFRTLKRAIKYTNRGFFIDFRMAYEKIKEFATIDEEKNLRERFMSLWNFVLINDSIPKTLLIPYFHSYYGIDNLPLTFVDNKVFIEDETNRNTIFGYNINPNNLLPEKIKKIARFRLFDIHNKVTLFIPFISKQEAKNRVDQDNINILNTDSVVRKNISTMFDKKVMKHDKVCDVLVSLCNDISVYSDMNVMAVHIIKYTNIDLENIDTLRKYIDIFANLHEKTEELCVNAIIYIADFIKQYGCQKQYEKVMNILKNPKPIDIRLFREKIYTASDNTIIKFDKYSGHILRPVYFIKENDILHTTEQISINGFKSKDPISIDKLYYDYIANGYSMTMFENNTSLEKEKDERDVENATSHQIYKKIKSKIPKLEYITFYRAYKMLFPNIKPSKLSNENIDEIQNLLESGKEIIAEQKEREEKEINIPELDVDIFAIPELVREDGFVENVFLAVNDVRPVDRETFQNIFNNLEEDGMINRDMDMETIVQQILNDLD